MDLINGKSGFILLYFFVEFFVVLGDDEVALEVSKSTCVGWWLFPFQIAVLAN